jgi:hypothetical protein
MPFVHLSNFEIGQAINLVKSTTVNKIKLQNKMARPSELNHKKYSKAVVIIKYRKVAEKNKIKPLIKSFT